MQVKSKCKNKTKKKSTQSARSAVCSVQCAVCSLHAWLAFWGDREGFPGADYQQGVVTK